MEGITDGEREDEEEALGSLQAGLGSAARGSSLQRRGPSRGHGGSPPHRSWFYTGLRRGAASDDVFIVGHRAPAAGRGPGSRPPHFLWPCTRCTALAALRCHLLTSGGLRLPDLVKRAISNTAALGMQRGRGGLCGGWLGVPVPVPRAARSPPVSHPRVGARQEADDERRMVLLCFQTSSARFSTASCERSGGSRRWRSSGDAAAAEPAACALHPRRALHVGCTSPR